MDNEVTRRNFLQAAGTAAVAVSAATAIQQHHGPKGWQSGEARYQAEVPDTLDLAERAEYAVRALTNVADPEFGYETPQSAHLDQRPAYMSWRHGGTVLQRPIEALPRVRAMSGSRYNQPIDSRMVDALTRDIEADGLWWLKLEGHPGRRGIWETDQIWPCEQAELMSALLTWYRYDRDPRWLTFVERMAKGLSRIALRNQDRAWYYTAYTRRGWREHSNPFGEQPQVQNAVREPATRPGFDIGRPLQAFTRWYAVSGDKQALELARRLVNFSLKPSMWGTGEGPSMAVAAERGLWTGHFHARMMSVIGLLDYALVTSDNSLKEFVANVYAYSRNFGIARIGFFPNMIGDLDKLRKWADGYGGAGATGVCDEGCAVADMTWIAASLSEAGYGDYWDDVDQYVRNHLAEHQILRRDVLEEIMLAGPEHKLNRLYETGKDVLERNIGCFINCTDPTMAYAWWIMCCNGNCARAMHKAWASILRHNNGVAQVNLLLNRASPWLDVDSYLPYEGKVVLKNKTARQVFVRIPKWADKRAVRCSVNQKERSPYWAGNYVVIPDLAPRDVVVLEFPVVESVERYTDLSYGQQYTCRFRGNTVVDIAPRAERPHYTETNLADDQSRFKVNKGYPLYQRDSLKRDRAPLRKREQYATTTLT